MGKNNSDKPAETTPAQPRIRKWLRPSTRAKGYAEERKKNVHQRGAKKGESLDDYNKGLRSGYLLCQSDHAGSYIYDKVLAETNDKEKAAAASQTIGALKNGGNK